MAPRSAETAGSPRGDRGDEPPAERAPLRFSPSSFRFARFASTDAAGVAPP